MEIASIIEMNGVIRSIFIDFLGSERFGGIVAEMKAANLKIGEINYQNHRILIEDYSKSGSGSMDNQEILAEKNGKYFRIVIVIDGDSSKAINSHRIVHPE